MKITLQKEYTVSFDANGGTGTMDAVSVQVGDYTLPANGFTAPNGGRFLGWALSRDGEVITSLELTGNVTLYARWAADSVTVMSWNVNLFGTNDKCADAVIAEIKAQNPAIAGLINTSNQSWRNSHISYNLEKILAELDYPFYYYVPTSAKHVFGDDNFSGSLILSKYPLTDMVTSDYKTYDGGVTVGNYIGHCVVDLGTKKVDLFTGREAENAATRTALYNAIQETVTEGNDFILFVQGAGIIAEETVAGKPVAVAVYDGVAVVASTVNQRAADMWMVNKPEVIANDNNGKLIISNEVFMTIQIAEEYTVSFNANGGTGTMDAVTATAGSYTLPANGFTAPAGKRFIGWSLTADGEVITSLELTGDVTLYARWGAETLKVMSWSVNLFGVNNDCADIIINEVKAQDPDIVGLANVGNQAWGSNGRITYTLDEILEKLDYPYYYYVPLGANYVYSDTNFYGHLILSKYPLTNMVTENYGLMGANYIGHCVADVGTAKLDLFITYDVKMAVRAELFSYIQANTAPGNDFILMAHGGIPSDATIAGKPVAVASYDSNIGIVASVEHQGVGENDCWKQAKPTALASYKGNALIGNEALMRITIK
jgi:endonuclease/exonuclease/phosphatase family metal-dependent hydrolase